MAENPTPVKIDLVLTDGARVITRHVHLLLENSDSLTIRNEEGRLEKLSRDIFVRYVVMEGAAQGRS